jgi:type IV secretory pathway TrbD component
MSKEGARKLPIYRGISRSNMNLLMGGDRELVIVVGMTCAALIVASLNIPAAVVGVSLWLIGMYVLRKMGKKDPLLRKIYLRHIRYGGYYAAREHHTLPGD